MQTIAVNQTTTNPKGIISMAKQATETTTTIAVRIAKIVSIVAPLLIAVKLIQESGAPSIGQVAAMALVLASFIVAYKVIK